MKKKAVIILLFLPLFVFGFIAAAGILMDTSRPPVLTDINITAAFLIDADGRTTEVAIGNLPGSAGRFVLLQNVNSGDRLAFNFTLAPYYIFEPNVTLVSDNINLGLFEQDTTGGLMQTIGVRAVMTLTGVRGDDWISLRDSANRDINDRIQIIIR